MKNIIVVLLVVIGFYWLFDHYAPLPLNHESFHLYNHSIHRVTGVILLVVAGILAWKLPPKKKS